MFYKAYIELVDNTKCDECPFKSEFGNEGQMFCKLGGFCMLMERSENVGTNGMFTWYTPRPRGCPLILDPSKV